MRAHLVALMSGAIFGAGLLISGMTRPAKVIGFLDLFGAWDASLMFVMMGAIAVHFVAYRLIVKKLDKPLLALKFDLSPAKRVDAKLVGGAALFGVGWGLAGYCPGPAVVSLASSSIPTLVFVGAMMVGMMLQHATPSRASGQTAPSAS